MRKWCGAIGATATLALVLAAPASALFVSWFNDETQSFSGSKCGDASHVTLRVPRDAFAVTVVQPLVGAKLTDDSTAQTDATITSIRRAAGGVTVTATGSDDVCVNPHRYDRLGWETNQVQFRVTYKTQERVLYATDCSHAAYRPHRIAIACGSRSFYVDGIRWSAWDATGARGVGTAHAGDAAGHLHSYPGVAVRLDRARYCRRNADFEFGRLQYGFTGSRPAGFAQAGSGRPGCAGG